jgi:hypothetical protein
MQSISWIRQRDASFWSLINKKEKKKEKGREKSEVLTFEDLPFSFFRNLSLLIANT